MAQIGKTEGEWMRYCAYAGALTAAAAVAAGLAGVAPLAGVLGFAGAYAYPWYRKKEIAGKMEKELPLALRSVAALLSAGMPFEDALEQCCRGTPIARQFQMALREASYGKTVPAALSSIAARFDSKELQKAISYLNSIYAKRGDPLSLKKLSEEIAAVQRAAMREYSGKLVVYSLVFIAVSAIVPALFQAYVIVGSSFMSGMVTAEQAFWVSVLGFPAADIAVLALIRLKRPFFA